MAKFIAKPLNNTISNAAASNWKLFFNISTEDIFNELKNTAEKPNELVFFVKPTCTSFPKVSQVKLCRELKKTVTPFKSIEEAKITRKNILRITTKDIRCAECILDLRNLLGVEVSPTFAYESISSIFLIKNMDVDFTLEEIHKQLTDFGIKILELRRFTRKSDSGIIPTRTVLCKYVGFRTLDHVIIFCQRFRCQTYQERPRQCYQCYRFGHFKSACRGKICCGKCGSNHNTPSCISEELKCINCKGAHASFDIKCPVYLEEMKILEIMTNQRCSYSSAKIERNRQLQSQQNESQAVISLELSGEVRNLVEQFKSEISEILRNGIKSIIQEITISVVAMINNHVNALESRERSFRRKG